MEREVRELAQEVAGFVVCEEEEARALGARASRAAQPVDVLLLVRQALRARELKLGIRVCRKLKMDYH